jgi:diaminohydroxyphosphoribosylaminopyrimidine deaminase/5-amino-6-(5-phosphoribosylamino)uracil reductase
MSSFSSFDFQCMAKALNLAKKGLYTTHPNPRVGCVIAKQGKIIGQGFHVQAGEPHAEINALRSVSESTIGATAYVTLEPCSHTGRTPPCANALIQAGVARVVVAMQDPNPQVAGRGLMKLQQAGITTETGLMEAEARALNPGFIKRMEAGLPWVRVKLAMSLDGRTAMASGESEWITDSAARQDVQHLRARADAILTGSGTLQYDDPSLNVRLSQNELGIDTDVCQPLRVLLDRQGIINPDAKTLSLPGKVLIFTQADLSLSNANVEIIQQAPAEAIDLLDVLKTLAQRQVNEVHVEAGATLCGALLAQGLVDEIVVYMAPHIMGDSARGLFHLPELQQMQDRIPLKIQDVRAVGDDWRIIATPASRVTI